MPEKTLTMKEGQQSRRPTSEVISSAERRLFTEKDAKGTASNKHVSKLLARSQSLDVLSTTQSLAPQSLPFDKLISTGGFNNDHNGNSISLLATCSAPAEEKNERLNLYVTSGTSFVPDNKSGDEMASAMTNSDDSSAASSPKSNSARPPSGDATDSTHSNENPHLTLLKENSELSNNFSSSNSSRSSSISTSSDNASDTSSRKSKKLQRRSASSITEGGGCRAAFQEVVLNDNVPIKISGYLEKRSKVLGWKKFWFVLDGRLLTYYKSKSDYESLSACCGCINLGIASTVRPIQIRGCKGYPLQIVTRSQVYYLRSQEKPVLEQWLIAIQETASSPPKSSASAFTSWGTSLGSQYFRHSYASQSQWSLNQSTEDITDISERLGNLPETFYEKRDRGFFSSNTSSHAAPAIQKYHSFTSLQAPVINNFVGRSDHLGRRGLVSSTENLRDLQDSNGSVPRMQQSTSLLVLDSSPQAAELRKELTRKLSIGSSKDIGDKGNQGSSESEVPKPKFLILSATTRKSGDGSGGDDESHHYAEIDDYVDRKTLKHYENCEAEKFLFSGGGGASLAQSVIKAGIVRGESIEKDGNIYEHIETVEPASIVTVAPAVIWESVNEGSGSSVVTAKRFPPHRLSAGSNRNSLVSISELPEDVSSISPSPIKTPGLTSIPEGSWRVGGEPYKGFGKHGSEDDLSSCRSESFRSLPCAEKSAKKRKGKAFGFLSKVFGKHKGKGNKSDSTENLHRPMIISGPVDLRKQVQMKEIKEQPSLKPPFGKKSSRIVNDTEGETTEEKVVSRQPANEITQVETKSSPTTAGYRMTINNTNVMDELRQKVGHITLKRTNSRNNSSPESESPPKENITESAGIQNVVTESIKIPAASREPPMAIKSPVLILQTEEKCTESNTDDDDVKVLQDDKKEMVPDSNVTTHVVEKPAQTTDTVPTLQNISQMMPEKVDTVDTRLRPKKERDVANDVESDFQNKLAKFNRLSQSLSATFIAALNSPHPNPIFGGGQVGRSYSYKSHRNKEVIPPLPPKKKNLGHSSGAIPLYDVPLNNKPVVFHPKPQSVDNLEQQEQREEKNMAVYLRTLTKKNSTPDIVLSGSGSSPKAFCLRDMIEDVKKSRSPLISTSSSSSGSDENFEVHKSTPSLPPPRPPKPKPPTKPKPLDLQNRIKRTSGSSTESGSGIHPDPSPSTIPVSATDSTKFLHVPRNPNSSPSVSNKSLDSLDNLDALSEAGLSDTKASSSPPDSPKVCCPIHMDTSKPDDDFGLSSDAKSPQSMTSMSMVPDSLATTPDVDPLLIHASITNFMQPSEVMMLESDSEPISINKLEIVIRNNDGSPGLNQKSPDSESRVDSLERITPKHNNNPANLSESLDVYQNLKFATVNTIIQEYETVEENEDEMSELYDDFPSEFYTPTPSSYSGYSPSEVSTTSAESSPTLPSSSAQLKKHARIDAIRNSGMEQLEAFLNFGAPNSSSDECSFESCTDSLSEDSNSNKLPGTPAPLSMNKNNNNNQAPFVGGPNFIPGNLSHPASTGPSGLNRTGAISRLGHSSAVGHLQKILTSDVK